MSKTINLSDKFSKEQPSIQIGNTVYPVNAGIQAVLAFQEAATGGLNGILGALKVALGDQAYDEIGVENLSFANIQVLSTGILAAQTGISYDEAAARFRRAGQVGQ
ncbi:conserved hypothetical protein [Paenibacillus curdlanolyticus YK9]|uniref:Uncharacterized protein n=1 Tax=Paenibacillus curdlanolyticus YK9 TaxID=717606 RepID=E0IBU1_9BACL|nr:hypothetical protein [Paenibacillus curdlanolyticus]EFM10171.1 conserved hypothetical protein [Paenibacillus curdlanolyticus YK9]